MYKIFYSPILRTFIKKLPENKISDDILSKEGLIIENNITCIDLDSEGYLTFIQADKVDKILKNRRRDELNSWGSLDNFWNYDMANLEKSEYGMWLKSRNQIKIGRFINQLFPNKYSTKEVEDFVNLVKSKQNNQDEFEIVSGDEIKYWYHENNYYSNCGELGNSCMKLDERNTFFDIYIKNPKCRMLILKRDNLLIGRSIIWKIDYKNDEFSVEYMMDRVYTNKSSDVLKFHEYAKENGWLRKYKNTYSDGTSFVLNDKKYEAKIGFILNKGKYDLYPYLDTFKYYNTETGLIQNCPPDENGFLLLENTSGGYKKYEVTRYSNYYDRQINIDDTIWSDVFNDWLIRSSCVGVNIGSRRGIYPDNFHNITYEKYLGKYVHIDDCVYNPYIKEYIFKENAVEIYVYDTKELSIQWVNNTQLFYTQLIDQIDFKNIKLDKLSLNPNIKYIIIN